MRNIDERERALNMYFHDRPEHPTSSKYAPYGLLAARSATKQMAINSLTISVKRDNISFVPPKVVAKKISCTYLLSWKNGLT